MSIDGTTTGEYITQEAIKGTDVVLTIDAKVQQVAEEALRKNEIFKLNIAEKIPKRRICLAYKSDKPKSLAVEAIAVVSPEKLSVGLNIILYILEFSEYSP